MIGRGKSISHAGAALAYAGEKLSAREIDRQYVQGESPQAIEAEFKIFQDFNSRCEKNTLAFVLSPTIQDGQQLNPADLRNITRAFVQEMKLDEHQYVAYAHRDKAHQHVHLYVNRISLEGKAYDDSFLSNRSSRLAEQIALERGMTTAREVQQQRQAEKGHTKGAVLEAHTAVLRQGPATVKEYSVQMAERGVGVHLRRNEDGKLIGVQYEGAGGEKIKASDVHRSLSANRLENTLSENRQSLEQALKRETPQISQAKEKGIGRQLGHSQDFGIGF